MMKTVSKKPPPAINKITFKQRVKDYLKHPFSALALLLVTLATIITVVALIYIIFYILYNGIPYITTTLFEFEYTSRNLSMMPAIINTFTMVGISLVLSVPIGVFSAIYLVEYAKRGSRLVSVVRLTTETLAGIPSIVYGLFGFLMFVTMMGFGRSMLAGALTVSIMILPVIMRTTEEALLAVPDSYREGSFGLGAGRLRTVFRIIVPTASSGILGGVILGVGRIAGETAALIFTAGTAAGRSGPSGLMDSGRTLSVHMFALLNEGMHMEQAYATAVVLLVMVLTINGVSSLVARKFTGK